MGRLIALLALGVLGASLGIMGAVRFGLVDGLTVLALAILGLVALASPFALAWLLATLTERGDKRRAEAAAVLAQVQSFCSEWETAQEAKWNSRFVILRSGSDHQPLPADPKAEAVNLLRALAQDTSQKRAERLLGGRAAANSVRDALIATGAAAWRNQGEPRQGWCFVEDVEDVAGRLA